eukprot:3130131-Rhodomonas_salina.2
MKGAVSYSKMRDGWFTKCAFSLAMPTLGTDLPQKHGVLEPLAVVRVPQPAMASRFLTRSEAAHRAEEVERAAADAPVGRRLCAHHRRRRQGHRPEPG